MKVQVLSTTLDNHSEILYDCHMENTETTTTFSVFSSCGISSVVERQPSKLNVRGSNPLFRLRTSTEVLWMWQNNSCGYARSNVIG